jgi:methylglyoxal synthase
MQQFDIAFTSHDSKKEELVRLIKTHKEIIEEYSLVATRNTGRMIQHATGLSVAQMHSGTLGGYQQLSALVASDNVKAVIFLEDPLIVHPALDDIAALKRICNIRNIPFASNTASAESVLYFFFKSISAHTIDCELAGIACSFSGTCAR